MYLASILPDNFQKIIPSLQPWIDSRATSPTAVALQNVFAQIEVFHILGLFALGSAVILLCLRLIGVGLIDVPASQIHKTMRNWLHIGVVVAIVSGLLMGFSNASKLYNNSAFLFKMVALVAAVIFSYAVLVPVAKADGQVKGGAKVGLFVAVLVWLLSLAIMLTKPGSNVGFFHLIFAGGLVAFAAMSGAMRWTLVGGSAVIVLVWNIVTHVFVREAERAAYDNANKLFMVLITAWIFGLIALNIFGKGAAKDSNTAGRFVGYATILVWITVGAGGRWIGLT
jgi:hypothetical protein